MDIEIISDAGRLREFQPEWSRFERTFAHVNPFQTTEWLVTWWAHFGSGTLRVFVFRERGEVTGVLPCFLHEWNGGRQLTLLGSGVSDYLDPLFEPRCIPAILDGLRAQLNGAADWDWCDWQDLSRETPVQFLGTAHDETPCSAIRIEQPFEEFLAARPKELRRNLARDRKKAEAVGRLQFEVVDSADAELMNALVDLHRARWQKAGESGMIQANRSEAFLREAAQRFAARGWLKIFTLRFGESIGAIILAFCNETTVFAYLTGFEPRYETLGLGRQLLAESLRYAHERGYRNWDFLRGDEPFKLDWGGRAIAKCRVRIVPAQAVAGL